MYGINIDFCDVNRESVNELQEFGVRHFRLRWYSNQVRQDEIIRLLQKQGISIMLPILCGYKDVTRGPLSEPEKYIEYASNQAGKIARKLRGVVKIFQPENELNHSQVHAMIGWRDKDWLDRDGDFKYELAREMCGAIRDGNPDALITINTDLLKPKRSGFYEKDLTAFKKLRNFVDFPSLNFYPQYPKFFEPSSDEVKNFIAEVKKDVGGPLVITETGCPCGPSLPKNVFSNLEFFMKFLWSRTKSQEVRALLDMSKNYKKSETIFRPDSYVSHYTEKEQADYIHSIPALTEGTNLVYLHKYASAMSMLPKYRIFAPEEIAHPLEESYFGIKRRGDGRKTLGWYAFAELPRRKN